MPLFRSSSKSPKEVVSELRETLLYLTHPSAAPTTEGKRPSKKHRSRGAAGKKHEHSEADLTKAAGEECAALLTSLKSILFADVASALGDKSQLDEVVKQCYDAEVLLNLVRASVLEELPTPEARRDVVRIFRYFLERQTDNTVKYIIKNQALISNLISGYESGKPQVVANCGLMLRACSRYKSLVWVILLLKSDDVLQFFDFMQSKQFEVLSDAFVTLKELLRHDDLTAKFLEENQDEVFQRLSEVLSSDFYISKHVCLEWLQELLTESNSIREYYYGSAANLKMVMTLLGSDPSVSIRFKALDLMQGFLTLTEKEREVREILLVNREKLNSLVMELLTKFDKDKKHCPEPGRKFLLKTLEDPELSPALSELIPVESHVLHDEEATEFHDHQPEPPRQDPTPEQPPIEIIDTQNEPEPHSQDERPCDQSQDLKQLPLVHDPTNDEEEEQPPDDEQTWEQEQLNERQQDRQLETEGHLEDEPREELPQAEKPNEDGDFEARPKEHNEQGDDSDLPESKEASSASQPDDEEQLQPSKDSEPEEKEKLKLEHHPQDDFEQPESMQHSVLADHSNEDQLQIEKLNEDTKSDEQPTEYQEEDSDQSKVPSASHSDKEQPQIEKPSKDSELEKKLNEHHQDDSDQPESKGHLSDKPKEEQLQIEESKDKEANQPEINGPSPSHSDIEEEEQPLTEQPQFNPSHQSETEESLVQQPNDNTEIEDPLPLHSELTSHEESQNEAPLKLQHEASEEHSPDLLHQQKNKDLSPGSLLSESKESLSDQPPPENKTALPDCTGDPVQPLPDIEETTPIDHAGGFAQPLPDTEETTSIDHAGDSTQPLPDTEEPLSSQVNGEEPETLPDQPPENETDRTEDPVEPLADVEGDLPEELLFNFDFSQMPTLESSKVQPLAAEKVEESLPKRLEQLEDVLTDHPDATQLGQKLDDSTKPGETQEQQVDDSTVPLEHPSETQEEFVQLDSIKPGHAGETQEQTDDCTTTPDNRNNPPDETQEQQMDDSTKPGEMQERQFDHDREDTTVPDHPDDSQEPPSADEQTETAPEEPLTKPSAVEIPKPQLPMEEQSQQEHQSQPLPEKQDGTHQSSDKELQLPGYMQQPEPEEPDSSTKEPSELDGTKELREQEQLPESELPTESQEILVD